jgi:solute carrier family 40 (iron-regulated transporter), member 1
MDHNALNPSQQAGHVEDGEQIELLERTLGQLPASLTSRLYVSHFLSTWNSRIFEFGAVLFLATIYPSSLLPVSIYAVVRGASAILLSPATGSWIDRGNRLTVVRTSIIGQRLAVAISCGLFWTLAEGDGLSEGSRSGLFAITVFFACIEKVCSVMNLVSVERDWVRLNNVNSERQ